MAPELPPSLVIFDSRFDASGELLGDIYYIEPVNAAQLHVRWNVGQPPPGYIPVGGGVAYASADDGKVQELAVSKDVPPDPLGNSRYRWVQGLRFGLEWVMFILILPEGYTLFDPYPNPSGTRNFNGRLALYWALEGDRLNRTRVEWTLKELSGELKDELVRINQEYSSDNVPILAAGKSAPAQDKVFMSYRRSDSEAVAGRVYDWLKAEFGEAAIFKDVDSVPLGADYRKSIDEAIGRCRVVLVVIGDQWLKATDKQGRRRLDNERDLVRIEIESALQRNIPIIPLLVGQEEMPPEEDLPRSLRELAYRNAATIRPDPDFHNDMNRLIESLKVTFNQPPGT